ncbi:O-antigen translocase [Edwardsiella tarda]
MLGLNKVLAIYVGPSGYAIIGQYQNFLQALSAFSSGALANGITKYTAEYKGNPTKQISIWKTSGTVSVFSGLGIAVVVLFLFPVVNTNIFNGVLNDDIRYWLSVSFVFMMLNSYLLSVLNGMKEVKRYVIINISGSFITLLITSLLAYLWSLDGAVIALTINQAINGLVSIFIISRVNWFSWSMLFGRLDKKILYGLAKFSVMALVAAICLPLAQIIIRKIIVHNISWAVAGYWEAINRISSITITVATTTLTLYYLPRLAEIKTKREIKSEIQKIVAFIFPLSVFCCIIVYFLRDYIISILFTGDFFPMRVLFFGQLFGDCVKILSWLFSFALLAKEKWREFVFCEISSVIFLILINFLFIRLLDWEYLSYAYLITYVFYLSIISVCFFRSVYRKMPE